MAIYLAPHFIGIILLYLLFHTLCTHTHTHTCISSNSQLPGLPQSARTSWHHSTLW